MKVITRAMCFLKLRGVSQFSLEASAITRLALILTCLVFAACSSKLPSDKGSGTTDNSTSPAAGGNSTSNVNSQPGGGATQTNAAATCAGGASATYIQQSTGFYPGAQSYFTSLGANWQGWADFAATCNTNVNTAVTTLTAQGWPCDGVANTADYVTACVNPLKQALCVAGNAAFCTK